MAAFLPEEGQRRIWQDGPDATVVGALVPGGDAIEVPGGWEISGRWAFLSGIHHSDHALLCAPVPVEGGNSEVRFLLVPRSAYTIERTWFTVGMRGTGSDTLALDPTFVPVEHTFARTDLIAGTPLAATEAPCYTVPLMSVSGLSFAGPLLGAAEGALAGWTAANAAKRAAAAQQGNRMSTGTKVSSELALARSAGELDAARLLLERAAREADTVRPGRATATRAHRDYALAADLLVESVGRLFRTAGTRAQSEADPFQRFWRDANSAAGHAVLQWEPAARGFAATVFEAHRA
jgi:alkylation response protein AidB-like acyl-CoA dehydrogenase